MEKEIATHHFIFFVAFWDRQFQNIFLCNAGTTIANNNAKDFQRNLSFHGYLPGQIHQRSQRTFCKMSVTILSHRLRKFLSFVWVSSSLYNSVCYTEWIAEPFGMFPTFQMKPYFVQSFHLWACGAMDNYICHLHLMNP